MKILAWFVLVIVSLNVLLEPMMYGKPRCNYGTQTWISSLISASMLIPLVGRILGWW